MGIIQTCSNYQSIRLCDLQDVLAEEKIMQQIQKANEAASSNDFDFKKRWVVLLFVSLSLSV
jgi:hypothetical protein